MKMGIGTRIIFSILLIIVIAFLICSILAALNVFSVEGIAELLKNVLTSPYNYILIAVSLLLICVCIALLFFGIKKRNPNANAVVLKSSVDGTVYVKLSTIEELAQRYLNEVYGIFVQSVTAKILSDTNVRINVNFSVKPEVVIQDVSQSITDGLKEYIDKYSGITVVDVIVKVLPISQSSKTK